MRFANARTLASGTGLATEAVRYAQFSIQYCNITTAHSDFA